MSISEQQLEANRLNAQKSTGPRTEEGRNRSKLNACRHGLTGQIVLMTPADREAFDQLTARMSADLKPVGELEVQLVHSITQDKWRLNRAAAIEETLFARSMEQTDAESDQALDLADAFTREAKNLQLLTLYEQRINRNLQKNISALKTMQKERLDQRANDMEDAMLLLQDSEIRKVPYEPANDGFVFSKAEIVAEIDRERRLTRAENSNFRGFNPNKPGLTTRDIFDAAYAASQQARNAAA
jgi:hypothetical protein